MPDYIETVEVDYNDLIGWPNNPRVHDEQILDESLAVHGQYRSVLARRLPDGRLQLLAGHGTAAAVDRAGQKVRVEVYDVPSDDEARAIVLVDNRANDRASYDEAKLLKLLDASQAAGGLAGTGWDEDAFRELVDRAYGGEGDDGGGPVLPSSGVHLADKFLLPPFDLLDARTAWWRGRKKEWLATGIESEIGRGGNLLFRSHSGKDPMFYRRKAGVEARLGRKLTTAEFTRDHYDPSLNTKAYQSGTSVFDPVLCELAYRWFSAPGWQVIDPFAGGSVRGIVAGMLGRNYHGNDLAADQIEANRAQAKDFVARGLLGGTGPAPEADGAVHDPEEATPVERRGAVWVKRDDLFTLPGGLAGDGGKVRSCLQLVQAALAADPGISRLVTAGSRHSPQVVIVAAVAAHLGLACTAHVPASKEGSPELDAATALGATLVEHRPGYNTVIVARAREDAEGDDAACHVPFGMETDHAVSATAAQARQLFNDWPEGARRLVVPVGSGMTLAGILAAADDFTPEIVGVQVGADPTDRLNKYAPGWQKRVTLSLVRSDLDYEDRVADTNLAGVDLDPVYEAKCLPFLEDDDVLWVVGRRPTPAVPTQVPQWSTGDSAQWVKTLEPESADLIFTCPPYLWLEKYSDDPADLSAMKEGAFEDAYGAIIGGAAAALRPDRFAVFVVGDARDKGTGRLVDFRGMTIRCAERAGMTLHSAGVLATMVGGTAMRTSYSFTRSRALGRVHQDVLVFVKGHASAAAVACGPVDVTEALAALDEELVDLDDPDTEDDAAPEDGDGVEEGAGQ